MMIHHARRSGCAAAVTAAAPARAAPTNASMRRGALRGAHRAACCGAVGRRSLLLAAGAGATAAALGVSSGAQEAAAAELQYELSEAWGLPRVRYDPEGWRFWRWRGYRCHYISAGENNTGAPVVLVHGYGASALHWRYQIPALEAAGHRVFALCLLGFGWSEKAVANYSGGALWADQIAAFIREVVHSGAGGSGGSGSGGSEGNGSGEVEPVVLAGNSLGGYASLVAAARYPSLVRGLMLLNSAGPLADPADDDPARDAALLGDADGAAAAAAAVPFWRPAADAVTDAAKRVVLFFAFQRARQPERIREVLEMVYTNASSIDDDLVESIRVPATDPNAAEVFFRINASRGAGDPPTVNALLRRLQARATPTLLLWGKNDPWITLNRAERMQALYPGAQLVTLDAAHCPHDDAPRETSEAMLKWLEALPRAAL